MNLRRLLTPRPIRLTRDGWPIEANIHEPGRRIQMPNGRVYYVDERGAWHRAKAEESMADVKVTKRQRRVPERHVVAD